jgi:hypothetical protein
MITSKEHFWRSDFIHCTISSLTVVVPCLTKSNFSATALDTSTIRFREVGPQRSAPNHGNVSVTHIPIRVRRPSACCLSVQGYSAPQNDNIGDSQNCRQPDPHMAACKLPRRAVRLRLSRNVVLQPKQSALTTSGRRQGGLPQQLYAQGIQQSCHAREQNG